MSAKGQMFAGVATTLVLAAWFTGHSAIGFSALYKPMFLRILFVLHLSLLLLAYFFAAVNPFMSPSSFPIASLVALGAPYVLAYAALYFVGLALWKRRWGWLGLAVPALLLLGNVVALGRWAKPKEGFPLRVMSFNIQSLVRMAEYEGYPNAMRGRFVQFLKTQKPDIICFQEYTESSEPFLKSNLALLKQAGYPYISFPVDSLIDYPEFKIKFGTLVASRYPIKKTFIQRYSTYSNNGEGVTLSTVQTPAGVLDVYNLHLSSMSLSVPRNDSRGLRNLKELAKDVKASRSEIFRRIIKYSYVHEREARVIRQFIDSSHTGHVLVCGDMNNVPNSYIYRTIKGPLTDAFASAGRGLGKSYTTGLPTIRIDYTFAHKNLQPVNSQVLSTEFSDHFALVTDFLVQK